MGIYMSSAQCDHFFALSRVRRLFQVLCFVVSRKCILHIRTDHCACANSHRVLCPDVFEMSV